jgi:phenylacetate-CoA ligase
VFAGRLLMPPNPKRPVYWRWNWAANTVLFSSYHLSPDTMPLYAGALERFQPDLIDTYPSSLVPLARFLDREGRTTIRPRAIITSSETLLPQDRALIERAFRCRVYDHYGAAEMAAFISQCERGCYHVNPEFGIVEVVVGERPALPGETGEMVATSFVNPVMPLIRYVTGDLAVAGQGECGCGRAFPVVDRVIGRADDVVVTPDGRRVGRLDPVFKAIDNVYETRIVQDAADHLRVEVVPTVGFAAAERERLVAELRARVGPSMGIEVVEVVAIPRTARGKLQTVVRLEPPSTRPQEGL